MPVQAPVVLVKLWVAKKLAVLLAMRVYGLKKLYRRRPAAEQQVRHGSVARTVR